MTNQEIIAAIQESGNLEVSGKDVKRNLLPRLELATIVEALDWAVEQGRAISCYKNPHQNGKYVVSAK